MAKQVRAGRTGGNKDERVATDRNAIKGVDKSKPAHPSPHAANTYKPGYIKPTKRG